jgi:hypothetical protein
MHMFNVRGRILVLILLTAFHQSYGQSGGLNILSPNTASLGKFVETPVNISSGTPRISIPLYNLTYHNIGVPVGLQYHASGVAIEDHPGWVGANFALNCGGNITRVVHGGPDDYSVPDIAVFKGYYFHGNLLNNGNWNDANYMQSICKSSSGGSAYNPNFIDDSQPDEFFFNFGDYTGSFFLDERGKWRVKTNANIHLEIQEELNAGDFYLHAYNSGSNSNAVKLYKLFTKFTITDASGVKYIFGGDENAIEFTRGGITPSSISQDGYAYYITANSWQLVKIINPVGGEVNFTYEKGPCLFKKFVSYSSLGQQQITGGSSTCGSSGPSTGGAVINPVYLARIESPTTKIVFSRSKSVELEYGNVNEGDKGSSNLNDLLKSWSDIREYVSYDMTHGGGNYNVHNLTDYLPHYFQKLDRVDVIDKITGQTTKSIRFAYTNDVAYRLTLLNLQISGNIAAEREVYRFEYYAMNQLPPYCSFKSDFWGYFNNQNYATSGSIGEFPAWRPVNPDYAGMGLLTKIVYPTGGYSLYEFEPNTYAKYLQYQPSVLLKDNAGNQSLNAGGMRIKKITSYDNFGADPITKEYFYARDYRNGGTNSSGILAGMPVFYDLIKNEQPCGGLWLTAAVRDNATHPLSEVGSVSVTYSEVTEKTGDGAYTVYKFSNFDAPQYCDELTTDFSFTPSITEQNSYQLSSLTLERGLLLKKELYSNAAQKVKEIAYTYNDDPGRKSQFAKALRYVQMPILPSCNPCVSAYNMRVWPFKVYYYQPFLKQETETSYMVSGATTKSSEYKYDQYRNTVSTRMSNGSTEFIVEETSYNSDPSFCNNTNASDYTCQSWRKLFHDFKIKNLPVEQVSKKGINATGEERVTSGQLFKYFNDKPFLKESWRLDITAPLNSTGSGNNFVKAMADNNGMHYDVNYALVATSTRTADNGNPLETITNNNREAYTYDFYNNHLTSKTLNAAYADIAYSSFEGTYAANSYDNNKGNWAFDPTAIHTAEGLTGSRSYNLAISGMVSEPGLLQNGKVYTISYWAKNGSVAVTDGTNTLSGFTAGPMIKGWQYFERTFTTTSTTIRLSGTGIIDELRLYPEGAQMQTATYRPQIGVVATGDGANRLTFYEYDSMGRLVLVKDQSGNIIKKISYGLQVNE